MKDNIEVASIDLMDAKLQLLLAVTWQNGRSDGISRLRDLGISIQQEIARCLDLFKSERDQAIATSQILDTLQNACQLPKARRTRYSLDGWTMSPSGLDLPLIHQETFVHHKVVSVLMREVKKDIWAQMRESSIEERLYETIYKIGEDERIPLHVPALVSCIMALACRPGNINDVELNTEVIRYEQKAEYLAENMERLKRMEIAVELLPSAEGINLQIDQSYSWSTLFDTINQTSFLILRLYTQLNEYGLVNDARFSHKRVKTPFMPANEFHKIFNICFIRASTLFYSGADRETRALRRSVVDTERTNVSIDGKQVSNSMVLLVPLENALQSLEKQLALFLIKLDTSLRKRCMNPSESAMFLEKLPETLYNIVVNHGMRRKIIKTKKEILFCLAGLIAEHVYMCREQNKELFGGKMLKTRADVDEYVAILLQNNGFQYNSETLRRKRTQWRRQYLDQVPMIFGLD